jgi:putative aldouronate transport system substrate-binding protein
MLRSKKAKLITLVLATALLVSSLLTGCKTSPNANASSGTSSKALAPYQLKWYLGGSPQTGIQAIEDAVNVKLKPINATLQIVPVDFGSYDQKMQMIISSGEQFDLCYTASWINNYYSNVTNNAFLPLDDLLNKYAPTINATLPKTGWDATKVNGKIYAIPNYQIWSMTNEIVIQKSLADKYNFDPKSVKSLGDIEPFLASVKKNDPTITPFAIYTSHLPWNLSIVSSGYDWVDGQGVPGIVKLNDASCTVLDQYELPEYKTNIDLMRKWYLEGYINKDAAIAGDLSAQIKSGTIASVMGGNYKPGGDVTYKQQFGNRDVYDIATSNSYLLTSSIIATMTAVSKTSKDPARAVMFYDMLFKDKDLSNLLMLGIENKNYKTDADGKVEMIANSGYDLSGFSWEMGNQFNQKLMKGQEDTIWNDTVKINNTAKASPILGFNFNPTPVKPQLANVAAITKEYEAQLETGSVDVDKILPEFISKLKSAGVDTIIKEEQNQINVWKKANGK